MRPFCGSMATQHGARALSCFENSRTNSLGIRMGSSTRSKGIELL